MRILFSCTFAPAAGSYEIHLKMEEQNTNDKLTLQGCLFILHKGYYIFSFYFRQGSLILFYALKFWKLQEGIQKSSMERVATQGKRLHIMGI